MGMEEGGEVEVLTCIECEDQHAELVCLTCDEPFCRPCWGSLHRCVWITSRHNLYQYSSSSLVVSVHRGLPEAWYPCGDTLPYPRGVAV